QRDVENRADFHVLCEEIAIFIEKQRRCTMYQEQNVRKNDELHLGPRFDQQCENRVCSAQCEAVSQESASKLAKMKRKWGKQRHSLRSKENTRKTLKTRKSRRRTNGAPSAALWRTFDAQIHVLMHGRPCLRVIQEDVN